MENAEPESMRRLPPQTTLAMTRMSGRAVRPRQLKLARSAKKSRMR